MKSILKFIFLLIIFNQGFNLIAQNYYYLFLKDKNGVEFNPYTFFDQKAIERRLKNNISLYDSTDFPINNNYLNTIENLSEEVIGYSRWFNLIAISATEEQIKQISNLEFIKKIVPINSYSYLARIENSDTNTNDSLDFSKLLSPQLIRMQGQLFLENNIDGTGIRIAVFDAGFPGVDKHPAFEHLRQNNKIIKTYNFPKKNENVYGWNSHGTMVLSCIAGYFENTKLGLATGSEFLLARTEVNSEIAKEEIWWMMAAEWADQNGADIISSSLGYGIDRYYISDMDGKTSLVSRAANMAAHKGILVVNSVGNEANKKTWHTIIAPADADSVLSVGGIEPSFDSPIDFSSLGPTADGRLKPNVSAYGLAHVAKPQGYDDAYGTSFSCPLVTGFAACAWQTNRQLSNMQLKAEIEKSAHLYPYFDYKVGYGVPEASYFFNKNDHFVKKKTFYFEEDDLYIYIVPVIDSSNCQTGLIDFGEDNCKDLIYCESPNNCYYQNYFGPKKVYYHIQKPDGTLKSFNIDSFYKNFILTNISIPKSELSKDMIIRVSFNCYCDSLKIETTNPDYVYLPKNDISKIKIKKNGINSKYLFQLQFFIGYPVYFESEQNISIIKSPSIFIGISYMKYLTKLYFLGSQIGISNLKTFYSNLNQNYATNEFITEKNYSISNYLWLELFNRYKIIPGGIIGHGVYFECGAFGLWNFNSNIVSETKSNNSTLRFTNKNPNVSNKYNFGIRAEIGWEIFSLQFLYSLEKIKIQNQIIPNIYSGIALKIPL